MVPKSSMRKDCLCDEIGIHGFSKVYHGRTMSDLNLFHCISDLAAAFVQSVGKPTHRGKDSCQAWLSDTGSREVPVEAQRNVC